MNDKFDRDPEALAWAREKLTKQLDFVERMASHLADKGETEKAEGYRGAAWRVRSTLIGGEGCVVGGFDERLPEFLSLLDGAK